MRWLAAALLLVGCGGADALDVAPIAEPAVAKPDPCPFPADLGVCTPDVLNGGTGPDDRRTICKKGGETFVFYPSGERWWYREPDGKSDPVICHVLP